MYIFFFKKRKDPSRFQLGPLGVAEPPAESPGLGAPEYRLFIARYLCSWMICNRFMLAAREKNSFPNPTPIISRVM